MPNHLVAATIYRNFNGPYGFAEYFALPPLTRPNLIHMLVAGSGLLGRVEFASKLLLLIYVGLLPLSVLLVIRRVGGDAWYTLLSFLLVYNYNVHYGFVNFVIAVPFVLFLFWLLLAHLERPAFARRALIALLLIFIYFMHAQATLFSLLLIGTCIGIHHRSRPARLLGELLVAGPVLAIFAIWYFRDPSHQNQDSLAYVLEYYSERYLPTLHMRGKLLYMDNRHLLPDLWGAAVGSLFGLIVFLLTVARAVAGRRSTAFFEGARRHWPVCAFVGCALGCFLLLPDRLPGQPFVYERFAVFVLLALIISASTFPLPRKRGAVVFLIIGGCLVHGGLYAHYFWEFQADTASFTPSFLPQESQKKLLAGLIYARKFRGAPIYVHFPGYFTVWRQGIATSREYDYRFGAILRRAGRDRLPAFMEWPTSEAPYDGRYGRADYLLVRGEVPAGDLVYLQHFQEQKTAGPWRLYVRTGDELAARRRYSPETPTSR